MDPKPDSRRYYELFVESGAVNWKDLKAKDPRAREDLDALSRIDEIRSAFSSGGPDPVDPTRSRGPAPQDAPEEETHVFASRRDQAPRASRASPPPSSQSPPPSRQPPPPPRDGGRQSRYPVLRAYEVVEQIGEGSFAKIYKARDYQAGRFVAIKILKSRAKLAENVLGRFLREARAMASMRHENVLRIYHVLDEDQQLGLCMELIVGRTLEALLRDRKRLPAAEVAHIGLSLCRALGEVHKAGFVHRDVKAENVMMEDGGRVVLMDFGLTHSLDPDSRLTATGVIVGTPVAMAPEQYKLQPIDARTDIYAIGCLLYRLISGEYPAMGTTLEEIRDKVISGSFPRIQELRPDTPKPLAQAVMRALEPNPAKRFQSALEMAANLDATVAPPLPNTPPESTRERRLGPLVPWLLGAILVTLLSAIGLLVKLLLDKS